jgi:hypothetical protein
VAGIPAVGRPQSLPDELELPESEPPLDPESDLEVVVSVFDESLFEPESEEPESDEPESEDEVPPPRFRP